jgi:hypothetical protein
MVESTFMWRVSLQALLPQSLKLKALIVALPLKVLFQVTTAVVLSEVRMPAEDGESSHTYPFEFAAAGRV